jgi:hypothetical protein
VTSIPSPCLSFRGGFAFLLLLTVSASLPAAEWGDVTSLDAPLALPGNQVKARDAVAARLTAQITANRSYLAKHPDDSNSWEARIRLASAQGRLASLQADSEGVRAAVAALKELERTVPDPGLRAEAMFRRVALQWQDLGDLPDLRRQNAKNLALQFSGAFPDDRRAARLLAEAAALSNARPSEKSELLAKASELCRDEGLGRRIKDDLLQIDQLGKPVDLAFNATDGTKVDLTSEQGRVTAVVFWSAESAPCLVWMKYFAKFADGVPALRVVTVSLDRNREDLDAAMRSLHLAWPTQFDGKGWQNAIARKFGINTVPTLWLLDKQGKLSQLNSRDCYELKVNELLLKK